MIIHILMETLFLIFKQKYLMMCVKYVLMKENKNLLNQSVDIKYAQSVLNNLKNKNNISKAIKKENYIIDEKNKISN